MRKLEMLGIILTLVFTFSPGAFALESGGKVDLLWTGVLNGDGESDSDLTESLNLELFLPSVSEAELRYEFLVKKPIQGLLFCDDTSYFTKKLYLKYRFEHFHLTLGRQPISWSFGSLVNPVDYTLGAVTFDEESNSKYTDALEVYIPWSWNSGLDLVASFPNGFTTEPGQMKWGGKARLGVQGFDLTMNYVREPESIGGGGPIDVIAKHLPRQRMGFTAKGDIGDFGVYGSLGHYFDEGMESSMSYLVGADYSHNIDYDTKITMQLEYLGLEPNSLDAAQRAQLLRLDSSDGRLDLLSGRLSYPVDDFSAISLLAMVSLDDGSLLLSPSYQNMLPGNIDLTVGASVFCGRENSLFAPGRMMPQAAVSLGLSYAF